MKGEMVDFAEVENVKAFRRFEPTRRASSIDPENVRGAIDLFIRDAEDIDFGRLTNNLTIENADIVDFVLEQEIVMERSPPFSISFKAILDTRNSPMWIGTFMGMGAAWYHPVLLLITVPGGIIIVGSAVGIGNAMQAGLNKSVKRLFDRTKP